MRVTAALFFYWSVGLIAQSGCIQGVVLDPAGSPIPYIGVIAYDPVVNGGTQVNAQDNGRFEITGLAPATYQILTSDEAFKQSLENDSKLANASATLNISDSETCALITLHRSARARLRVKAIDSLTGEGLKTVQAQFRAGTQHWRGSVSEQRDLLVPPLDEVEIRVGAQGYQESEVIRFSSLPPGEVRDLVIALRPLQTGCLTGTVTDQQGVPVAGVGVTPGLNDGLAAEVAMKKTDQNGRFVFRGLQPGRYLVFAHAEMLGYLSGFSQDGSAFTAVEIQPSAGCKDFTIKLGPKAARLHVKVVDLDTQKPIPSPIIWMARQSEREGWSMRWFEETPFAPSLRQFDLSVSAKGYKSRTITISPLQPEQTEEVTIELLLDGKAPR